jgi:hypothetical protein
MRLLDPKLVIFQRKKGLVNVLSGLLKDFKGSVKLEG